MKDGETTLTEESIIQYCKEKLASYKIRSSIHRRVTEKRFRKSVEEGITRCSSCEIENYKTMENPVMYKA